MEESAVGEPDVLWSPDPERARMTAMADFTRWVKATRGTSLSELDYAGLHRWSVADLEGFWSAAAEYLEVVFRDPPLAVLDQAQMPGARWFRGATLNYAQHALTPGPGRQDGDTAVVFCRE